MSKTSGKPLKPGEKVARLRLAKSEHVGPITFRELLGRYGTAAKALEVLLELELAGHAKRHPGNKVSLV